MKQFALSDGTQIINVIVAESKKNAEEAASGFEVLDVVDGVPWIGWNLVDGEWIAPQPYPSWIWDGTRWNPPVPYPSDPTLISSWNENAQQWDSVSYQQALEEFLSQD